MDAVLPFLGSFTAGAATMASMLYLSYHRKSKKLRSVLRSDNQARTLPGRQDIVVSHFMKGKDFIGTLYGDAKTLYECLLRGRRVSSNGIFMWQRADFEDHFPSSWITYNEVIKMTDNFRSGLVHFQLEPGSFVGIWCANSVEYMIAEFGCYSHSIVVVPLSDALGLQYEPLPGRPRYPSLIINETEMTTVVCDTKEKVIALIGNASQMPTLKNIVWTKGDLDDLPLDARDVADFCGINVVSFDSLLALGAQHNVAPTPPLPTTLAVVCYKRNAKGVMLTHQNIVANASAIMVHLGDKAVSGEDFMLSCIPLTHMSERCCLLGVMMVGGSLGFTEGDLEHISKDLRALKPTVVSLEPRLLNEIHRKIQDLEIHTGFIRWSLNLLQFAKGNVVYQSIRDILGGRIRLICNTEQTPGGHFAPIGYLQKALGCFIVEGYGHAECSGYCTLTVPRDREVRVSAPPLPCCAIKLIEAPEIKYSAEDDRGEICVKGSSMFSGYLKDMDATRMALDNHGWFHTRDIGRWNFNHTLSIIDYMDPVIVLDEGQVVSPEKVEAIYAQCPLVRQVFVDGYNYLSGVVGIVVVEEDTVLQKMQRGQGDAIFTDEAKDALLKKLTKLGEDAGLQPYEQVKNIFLTEREFTVENELLFESGKINRELCSDFFGYEVESMLDCLQ